MVTTKRWPESVGTAATVACLIAGILWAHHPPLYHADGYGYFIGGLDPKNGLNPHHLMWVPIVGALITLSQLVHFDSLDTIQLFGIFCISMTSFFIFSFLRKKIESAFFVVVMVTFISLSPWFWLFSTQNQPYSLLLLVTALLIKTLAPDDERPVSSFRIVGAGILVCLAIGLQQATVFWVPAIAVYLWNNLPNERRTLWCAGWLFGTALLSAAAYAWAAYVLDISTWSEFVEWFTSYIHDQHSIEFHPGVSLVQSTVGILHIFFQCHYVDEWLLRHVQSSVIVWVYMAVLLSVAGGLWRFCRGSDRPESRLISARSRQLNILILAAWSFFCFLWEPVNYYWYIGLVPFCYLTATSLARRPVALTILMIFATGWNVYADIKFESYYGLGAPALLLPKIMALKPSDRYIVVTKGRPRNADYGILEFALANANRENQSYLIDDIVFGSKGGDWQMRLAKLFQETWNNGGKVFITKEVSNPYAFQVADTILSPYKQKRLNQIDSAELYQGTKAVLSRYDVKESAFQLGDDHFFQVRNVAHSSHAKLQAESDSVDR